MNKASYLFVFFLWSILANAQIKPENEFQLGMQQYYQKNYKQAIPFFNALIEKNEDQYRVLYFRGLSKFALSDFIGAESDLKKSTYYKPFYPEAFHNLALVQLNSGKILSGIQNLNKSLKQDSLNAEAYYHRAISYFQINQFDASIEDINNCLNLNALQLKAIRLRAECYKNQEKYELAMDDISILIEKKVDLEKDVLLRAELYQAQEKYEKSLSDANYILSYINKENLDAKYIKAFNYHKLKESEKSMALVEEILAENPYHTQAIYLKGLELWKQEKYTEAKIELNILLDNMPKNVLIMNDLAKINIQQKRYNQALKLLNRSKIIFEHYPETYELTTRVYLLQNKNRLAQKEDELYQFYKAQELSYAKEKQFIWKQKYLSLKPLEKDEVDKNKQLKDELRLSQHVKLRVTSFKTTVNEEKSFKSALLKELDQIELYPFKIQLDAGLKNNEELPYEQSLEQIDSLIVSGGPKHQLEFIKALLYFQNFRIDEAEEQLLKIVDKVPTHTLSNALLAQIYWIRWEVEKNKETSGFLLNADLQTETEEAKKLNRKVHTYFTKAIESNTKSDFIYYNYALFLAQQKKAQAAIELLEKAYLINPNEKEIAYNLALINYKSDRFEEACKYLSLAGELGKEDAYDLIAVICR